MHISSCQIGIKLKAFLIILKLKEKKRQKVEEKETGIFLDELISITMDEAG